MCVALRLASITLWLFITVTNLTVTCRFGYNKLFCKMVEAQCGSPKDALTVAEAGLAYMHENFEFVNDDGSSVSFKEAMGAKNKVSFIHSVSARLEENEITSHC